MAVKKLGREIRPIVAGEADQFLSLLCEVFNLDKGRAGSVFFAEPFFDLKRKWALFDGGEMRSIMTTTPLTFGDGKAIGIAGVATLERYQGKGLASEMMDVVLRQADADGEGRALLFAHAEGLYKRHGFETLDEVVRGGVVGVEGGEEPVVLSLKQVERRYEKWASLDKRRLLRDERRWKYWGWVYRTCEGYGDGYICSEPMLCREAAVYEKAEAWPVSVGTDWVGLRSLTRELGVPIGEEQVELLYMGRGFSEVPVMFMTDQF